MFYINIQNYENVTYDADNYDRSSCFFIILGNKDTYYNTGSLI